MTERRSVQELAGETPSVAKGVRGRARHSRLHVSRLQECSLPARRSRR